MPFVIVEMHEGRTIEMKKQLAADITAAFEKIGTSAEHVHIVFNENPKHNWASNGKLDSEKAK